MTRWCALVLVAACQPEPPEPPDTKTEIFWQSGADRLVLDEEIFHMFPDATARYLVSLEHPDASAIVLAGSLRPERLQVRGTRLRDGHIAWATAQLVCEELGPHQVACNDFIDLSCFPTRCCIDTVAPVTCTCGAGSPDRRLSEALRWVAGDARQDSGLRVGAVFALARTGSRAEALKLAASIYQGEGDVWVEAIRPDPHARKALRELYSTASRCVRDQIDRATAN